MTDQTRAAVLFTQEICLFLDYFGNTTIIFIIILCAWLFTASNCKHCNNNKYTDGHTEISTSHACMQLKIILQPHDEAIIYDHMQKSK